LQTSWWCMEKSCRCVSFQALKTWSVVEIWNIIDCQLAAESRLNSELSRRLCLGTLSSLPGKK
jgi:hypothetical protein